MQWSKGYTSPSLTDRPKVHPPLPQNNLSSTLQNLENKNIFRICPDTHKYMTNSVKMTTNVINFRSYIKVQVYAG